MPIALDELPALEREHDELRRQEERSKGRVDEIRRIIKERFGCATTKAARLLLKKKQRARLAVYQQYNRAFEKFKKEMKRAKADRLPPGD